jgi:hypothetical protein
MSSEIFLVLINGNRFEISHFNVKGNFNLENYDKFCHFHLNKVHQKF